jgi:predicted RNA-binding Zn-ribbon protein involved in translation (DUF1610 family)
MNRTTIEEKHQKQLEKLSEQEKINYLLDVSHILEIYGEDDNTTMTKESDTYFDSFVEVVSRNNNGSLYEAYVNIVDGAHPSSVEKIDSYVCVKCDASKCALGSDSHMVCPSCGESEIYFDSGTQGMSYEQEINSEVNTSFAYKRINHFNEWLAQFQAKETTPISSELLDDIRNEFKKARIQRTEITQNKVKLYLKKLGYNKFYEHCPQITNILNNVEPPTMNLQLEEQMRTMFRHIQEPFELHKPKSRSNFLSYSYCLYKFCELLSKDEYLVCFPLLKSREKLHQQDVIWKKICDDMNWQFIPTL